MFESGAACSADVSLFGIGKEERAKGVRSSMSARRDKVRLEARDAALSQNETLVNPPGVSEHGDASPTRQNILCRGTSTMQFGQRHQADGIG
jgi:hypothetical protein